MSNLVEITTTLETLEQAQELGRRLVESRLAACAQLTGPITSIYRWEGQVCEANEVRLTLKTTLQISERAIATIESLHPYDVPEILVLPVQASSTAYRDWLLGQLISLDE